MCPEEEVRQTIDGFDVCRSQPVAWIFELLVDLEDHTDILPVPNQEWACRPAVRPPLPRGGWGDTGDPRRPSVMDGYSFHRFRGDLVSVSVPCPGELTPDLVRGGCSSFSRRQLVLGLERREEPTKGSNWVPSPENVCPDKSIISNLLVVDARQVVAKILHYLEQFQRFGPFLIEIAKCDLDQNI